MSVRKILMGVRALLSKRALTPFALLLVLGSAQAEINADVETEQQGAQSLEHILGQAIANSPKLMVAKERWNIGQARTQQATAELLPTVNLLGSFSENRRYSDQTQLVNGQAIEDEVLSKYNGEKYTAQLRQVLFNWATFAGRSKAGYLEDQSEAEYYDELSWLLVNAAEKYLAVLEAEDHLRSTHSEAKAVHKQLRQIEKLYEKQLAKVTDLYEGQARAASVDADHIDAANQLNIRRVELMELTGHDVRGLYRLNQAVVLEPIEGTLFEWLEKAKSQSDLIKARRAALRAAEKGVSERRGAYLPQVSLIAQHQKSDIGYENTSTPRSETIYVGVDVTIPIFAGGGNRARVREAVSQANIARSELVQVQRESDKRVRTAFLSAKSSYIRTKAAAKLAESTYKASEAMQKGFSLGTVTSVDVLNALRDQYVAERDWHKSRYDQIKQTLQLKREAGVLGAGDIEEVNQLLVLPKMASLDM